MQLERYALDEKDPVRQVRQRVVGRPVLQLLLVGFALGDVAEHGNELRILLRFDCRDDELDREAAAVASPAGSLQGDPGGPGEQASLRVSLGRVDEFRDRPPDDLGLRAPEHDLGRTIEGLHATVLVDGDDRVEAALHDVMHQRFRAAHRQALREQPQGLLVDPLDQRETVEADDREDARHDVEQDRLELFRHGREQHRHLDQRQGQEEAGSPRHRLEARNEQQREDQRGDKRDAGPQAHQRPDPRQ